MESPRSSRSAATGGVLQPETDRLWQSPLVCSAMFDKGLLMRPYPGEVSLAAIKNQDERLEKTLLWSGIAHRVDIIKSNVVPRGDVDIWIDHDQGSATAPFFN